MRTRSLSSFLAVLVCSFSAVAQSVVESGSSVSIKDATAVVSLVVHSGSDLRGVPVSVKLLDPQGLVEAESNTTIPLLREGTQTVDLSLSTSFLAEYENEDLAWYRLQYRVGAASGIISMSQLVKDLFELRVIATDNLLSGMSYRVRVRAVNPFTERPASGVQIEANLELDLVGDASQKLSLKGSAETDADGFAVVDLTIPVEARLDGDGEINVVGRKNGIVREADESLKALKEDVQFLIMTDKPIYQPEQMLNVRGIFMKGGEAKMVVAGCEVEFRISDEDDTVLYREKVMSSAFGIASIGWRIPSSAKLGDYRIKILDERGDEIGGDKVKVSRYDLPNFVVEAKAAKTYYLPGENEAAVEVRADYLFGKPVTRGKVRVVEETGREWNWKAQKYDIDEGEVREGETDAANAFTARFDLKEAHDDLKDDGWRKYRDIKFAAYFTDLTTNKTEQRRFDIRVSREPIHVYLIGDTYDLNGNMPINAYVSTFYADGSPAECDVEVKASEDDEDKYKTVSRLRTNAYGAGKLSITRPAIGDADDDLDLKLIAKDGKGRRGTFVNDEVSFDTDDAGIQVATDKTVYKPGETMTVRINSTIKSGPVYVDIVSGWSVIESRFAELKNGKAELHVPYSDAFKGELKVAAFVEESEDDLISASRGVIFPARQAIKVDASFDKSVYKPGEEATVKFGIVDAIGQAVESALGIVVLDRAVEERARTDADFGGMWRSFSGWLGYGDSFGGFNVKDLNELDLTKPISDEMQMVAEVILHDNYYRPNVFRSSSYYNEAKSIFSNEIDKQFGPLAISLKNAFDTRDYIHPVDDATLQSILKTYSIDFDQMTDPWGVAYKAEFSVTTTRDVVTIRSAGPDKAFGTKDDFTAYTTGFEYFTSTGKSIDTAVKNYHERTGRFIRDEKALFDEMGVIEMLDRFGRPYRILSRGDGRFIKLIVHSAGPDGKFEAYEWMGGDFSVWTSSIDYFAPLEARISQIQAAVKKVPLDEADFRSSLKAAAVDLDDVRDGYGNAIYITVDRTSRYWDKVVIETVQKYGETGKTERRTITPVTQQIIEFTIRSSGGDGKAGTYDDVTLMRVVHVLAEQTKDDPKPVPVFRPAAFTVSTGAIAGTITDANGAAVGGATVTATNADTKVSRSTTTNENGRYLIANLAAGRYSIKAEARAFSTTVMEGVPVTANSTAQANITLQVANVSATVDVTGGSDVVSTSSAQISGRRLSDLPMNAKSPLSLVLLQPGVGAGTKPEKSTPRLREYFPETLLWRPEVLTGADGKAQVTFRMGDNITTWKMYTIASTKNGKIGVAEKEITAFQPFFVDLDPPRYLTEGDEIYLPTQIRNYTEKRQQVDVTMAKADWFTFLGGETQRLEVGSGKSENSIFGFKTVMAVKDGKQKVTAIAQTDSDAIEKPVTVKPDGEQIVRTDSRVSNESTSFDTNFPANALKGTQRAELKIYPNLFAHVIESVEGLLQRPYGCGEQTISSTYPNLMVLKFIKTDTSLRKKAKDYLQKGYERLLGYQVADGGFTYWGGKDTSDVALTAYALRFLNDAGAQIVVDEDVIERAEVWLAGQQRADGSWTKKYYYETTEDVSRTKLTTTYVARSMAMRKGTGNAALTRALEYLGKRNAEIDEPYALALFGLAALDAGDSATAGSIAKRLETMVIDEAGAAYWRLETNTPFYGWGTAGRVETTALVLQLLVREAAAGANNAARKDLISKATLFLLKNKDRYGVWHSTQTTINVLDAFLAVRADQTSAGEQTLQVLLNGEVVESISVPADKIDPVAIDLTGKLGATANNIEVKRSGSGPLMSQVVASHYIDWRDSDSSNITVNASRALRLDYKCDKPTAAIMQEVTCSVEAERIGFKGYGMLLAEIGTPPGADVSRESLEKAIEADWTISRYDVLPDRIVLYMWSKAGGTKFNFKFKPRYGINAQTPASVVYDYYNPEARAVAAPLRFSVK